MVEAASSRGSSNIAFFVPFLSWLIKKHNATPPTLAPPSLQKRTRTRRHKSIASNETIENPGKHNERWRRGLRERDREESFSLESSLFSFLLSFFCSFSRFPFSFLSGLITKFVSAISPKARGKGRRSSCGGCHPGQPPTQREKSFSCFFFCFFSSLRDVFPSDPSKRFSGKKNQRFVSPTRNTFLW